MALHKNFPKDKYQILDSSIRWFPAEKLVYIGKRDINENINLVYIHDISL